MIRSDSNLTSELIMNIRVDQEHRFQDQSRGKIGGSHLAPEWDPQRRELRLGGLVIKRFKWPAANQTSVLEAFQQNGWPEKIYDPLPLDPDICPKRRLHDTIKCLNRNQTNKMIKFRGDGTGRGVLVEIQFDTANT